MGLPEEHAAEVAVQRISPSVTNLGRCTRLVNTDIISQLEIAGTAIVTLLPTH